MSTLTRRQFATGAIAAPILLVRPSQLDALASNYPRALGNVLVSEGGYSNHPRDPGGVTLHGVIQRRYDQYRRDRGLPLRALTPAMARDPVWQRERAEIYRQYYADPIAFDALPIGLDYCVFDYAVNSGIGRAPKVLQRILHVEADGEIGPATLAAIAARRDDRGLINAVCDERLRFVHGLRTCATFCPGWDRRIGSVRTISVRMATPGLRGSADNIRPLFGVGASYVNGMQPAHDPDEPEVP